MQHLKGNERGGSPPVESFALKVYSSGAYEHMDVRMKLKISPGGMARGNNGRKEMSFFTPGKYGVAGGPKETVKQEPTFIKKLS